MSKAQQGKNGSGKSSGKPAPKSSANYMKYVPWIAVAVVVLIIAVFALKPAATSGTTNVDAAGVEKAMSDGTRIVDVRSVGEFEGGHIPGAQNVPLDQFTAVTSQWDKTQPVLVYCQTGSRSAEAVTMLEAAGFTTILHYNQGIVAWTGALEQGSGSAAPATTRVAQATATPVMYEFYTDW